MSSSKPNRRNTQSKGGARRNENNRLYANPLPLLFPTNEEETQKPTSLRNPLRLLSIARPTIVNPHCTGIFDSATRSVWVIDHKDAMILWRRGFFGKGDLSRSEPSWLARQINAQKAAAANSP